MTEISPIREQVCCPLPRFVGNPRQFICFDEPSFDAFIDANDGSANCYCRISWVDPDGKGEWVDRVFLDLDSDVEVERTGSEMVDKLHANADYRENVLGSVVEDLRSIGELLRENSIPAVGVFSGKGVHVHAFYEERLSPKSELKSQTEWMIDQADVDTFDRAVKGDVRRLCRIPNCRRYDEELDKATGLYTIPIERREMVDITADELVKWSQQPRSIDLPADSRPPLMTHPDYQPTERESRTVQVERIDRGEAVELEDELIEEWVRDVCKMPCISERLLSRNPHNKVRFAGAVIMLNAGMYVDEIVELYSQLGWHDFDAEITRNHVEHIKKNGYSSVSCGLMQEEELCMFPIRDREDECEWFGYTGGNMFY